MRGDAFIHFVSGSRRVNIRLGVLLLIPKSPQIHIEEVLTRIIYSYCYMNKKYVERCDGKLTKIPKRDFIFARVKTGQVGT